MLRVVLDTNVIVAAIRSRNGASHILVTLAAERNPCFEIVLSESLANEYEDVIHRPVHRVSGWNDADLSALIDSLLIPAHWAKVSFSYRPLLDDPGDELVLEAAINGEAAVIVTFNVKDFRPAARFGIDVLTPGEFLRNLTERGFSYGEE